MSHAKVNTSKPQAGGETANRGGGPKGPKGTSPTATPGKESSGVSGMGMPGSKRPSPTRIAK